MTEYDNLCKYLAEKHPDRFASWLLGQKVSGTRVFKTELSLEPVFVNCQWLIVNGKKPTIND